MDEKQLEEFKYQKHDEISLREFFLEILVWWKYLLSKWLIILIAGISGGVLGLVYSYSQKPIYIAETTFVLDDDKGGASTLGRLGGLAGLAGVDLSGGGGIFQADNIIQLYKSRSMIVRALFSPIDSNFKKGLLIDRYIEVYKLNKEWEEDPRLQDLSFNIEKSNRRQDSIVSLIVRDINENCLTVAKPDKKQSIISVTVRSIDEVFSKEFTEEIVSTVNRFYTDTKTKKSLQNVLLLQQKTDSVRTVMNGDIYRSVSTIDNTPNINITKQVLRVQTQKSQFNAEANKIMLEELIKNLEMSKLALSRETPLIQVVDSPVYPLEIERLGKIKAVIIGGFTFGFLISAIIIFRRMYNNLINER